MAKGGISGLSVAVAAVGGFVVYAGIRDVPLVEGLRELLQGKVPTGREQKKPIVFPGKASTGIAKTGTTTAIDGRYKLGAVQPHVKLAAYEVGPQFNITTIGGWRAGDAFDHPRGLALDFMIDNIPNGTAVGGQLANYLWTNRDRLGITYVIWNRRIISVSRQREGWRRYSGASPHTDHVHGSFEAVHTYRTSDQDAAVNAVRR